MSHYLPTEKEMLELLNGPDIGTVIGKRDRAIIELLYSSALRRAEIYRLNLEDIDLLERTVRINKGKFDKGRVVPFGRTAKRCLEIYLTGARPELVKNPEDKALFISDKGGRLGMDRYYGIIKKYAVNKRICVHSLRHACATHMLKRGADIAYIQRFLGHVSPSTTQIYTRLFPVDLVRVMAKLKIRDPKQKGNPIK